MLLTVQTSSAGSVHNTAELLLAEVWPRCLGASECALEMDKLHLVPFIVGHVLEAVQSVFKMVLSRASFMYHTSCPFTRLVREHIASKFKEEPT